MHARFLAVILAVALSGCSGGGSGSSSGGDPNAPPGGGDLAVGAIAGLVTDDEQRPLGEASVRIVSLERSAVSQPDGRFLFAQVPVGNYTIEASRGGFETRSLNASVQESLTTTVLILLVALPGDVAYHDTYRFAGQQKCMIYTSVFLMPCSYPYTAAHGTARSNGVNLSQYGAPNDPIENIYRYNFTVGANHTGIVSELLWQAQTDASRYYVLQIGCAYYSAAWDDCLAPGQTSPQAENTYVKARGVNPIRIEWNHEKPNWLPWVMSRAYLSGPVDRPAGAALDQRIEMYNTVFYGAPVPDGWTIRGTV